MASELKLSHFGYVCAPYLHTSRSTELSESWVASPNIEKMFFVTCTLSNECKPYFSDYANHYLLAKFKDSLAISNDLAKHNQNKMSFVFNVNEDLFQREVEGGTGFVSVYYLEYGSDNDGLQDVANILLKREKITKASFGSMETFCLVPPKFQEGKDHKGLVWEYGARSVWFRPSLLFPYSDSIVVVEVASEKSHQSLKKYCEHTRRDANRKGLLMTNMMSLSILEQLK